MHTMSRQTAYMLGSAIVWAGIFAGSAVVLKGTPYFMRLFPIFTGGMVWSVVLTPLSLFRQVSEERKRR